jgi:hypothetical protein
MSVAIFPSAVTFRLLSFTKASFKRVSVFCSRRSLYSTNVDLKIFDNSLILSAWRILTGPCRACSASMQLAATTPKIFRGGGGSPDELPEGAGAPNSPRVKATRQIETN